MCGIHFYKSTLKIIRTGADVEETCRELGRLRSGIESAMIGQSVNLERLNGAIFVGCDLGLDMIVTTKPCTAQVLRTVFNPFDWLARDN